MRESEYLTTAEFRHRFPGESETVEFKQGVSADRIANAITSFSNTGGGTIVVGIAPSGELHGTATDGEAEARLHRAVAQVHRPGRYELVPLDVDGVALLAVIVLPREGGFAQTGDGRVLVRRGVMNVPLIGEQLDEFVARRALRRFETQEVDVDLGAADTHLIRELADAYGWPEPSIDRLIAAGFVSDDAGHRLTVAGALYVLPDPASVLGKPYIEIFRYRDDGSEDKRSTIGGPLHHQVAAATSNIMDEIGHDIVVLGVRRYELNRVPPEVLREAIANAVAHRVYEDHRRSVRVEVHTSRITITSPGPLPEPVTVATMRELNAARNVRLIEALRRFRLAEDAGRGIDLMQDVMAEQMLDPPAFQADERSVTVTLPLTSTVTPTERAWVTEIEARGELLPGDQVLLVHAARGEMLTNSYVRDLLGIDSTHARAALHRLRDAKLLRQIGHRAGAHYLLGDDLSPPAGLRLSESDLRRSILQFARKKPVTNRLVRERLGLDRTATLRLLKQLVSDGDLVREGERRGARYRLPGR